LICRLRAQGQGPISVADAAVTPPGNGDEWQAKRFVHRSQWIFDPSALTIFAILAALRLAPKVNVALGQGIVKSTWNLCAR
jgi:hypothetical protein